MRRGEHPLETIRRDFATLFDRFFGRMGEPLTRWPELEELGRGWGLEVKETEKEVVVEVGATRRLLNFLSPALLPGTRACDGG